jgi:hypothetical protein
MTAEQETRHKSTTTAPACRARGYFWPDDGTSN